MTKIFITSYLRQWESKTNGHNGRKRRCERINFDTIVVLLQVGHQCINVRLTDLMLLTSVTILSFGIFLLALLVFLWAELIFLNQIRDQDRLQKTQQHQSENHNAVGC